MRRTDTDLVDATAGPFATPPSVTPVSSAVLKMASSSSSSSAANYYMYACQQKHQIQVGREEYLSSETIDDTATCKRGRSII